MAGWSENVEEAIAAIARGEIVVVVDDADRENEGDLVMAAEFATAARLAFFVRYTSGLICAAVTNERADELDLPLMVSCNTEAQRTAFTVTVDYRHGTTTGISAGDRALTIRSLVDPMTIPSDLARPGHLHVLRAREGGVLKRAGHTEAAVDLAKLAGLQAAGVLCEIVTEDGQGIARGPELERFARAHDLPMISVADLIRYRMERESLVRRSAQAQIPTEWGDFTCYAYDSLLGGATHFAFGLGDISASEDVLVRVHSECLTGDIFRSQGCECGAQLRGAMQQIADEGVGVVVYLRGAEGRGVANPHKRVKPNQADLRAEGREYGIGAQILADLGVTTMRLVTNRLVSLDGLSGFGLTVVDQVPAVVDRGDRGAPPLTAAV